MNALIKGGSTTATRFIVELIYLAVSGGVAGVVSYYTNNNVALPEYLVIARLVLGLIANLVNSKLTNV